MNLKWLFEGGVPGETYGDGVRRRGKGMAVTLILVLLSAALVSVIFSLTGSMWPSIVAAALCGFAFIRISTPFDLPVTRSSTASDKITWLVLFAPLLLVLGGASIYEARLHESFQAAALAGFFGAVVGGTVMVLTDADSRTGA
jgi:hypothetical protein